MTKGLEFDPGFGPHIMAFQGTVEYLYRDINRFKNFSQKKVKFLQYHNKFLDIFYNNLGFYAGCLMWAAYVKAQEKQPILNNYCFGQEYDEENNTAETDFMIRFAELFPKDMKYFINKDFKFPENVKLILDLYRDFLIINKGFIETKENTDLKLPEKMKTENVDDYKKYIESSIETGELSKLADYIN